jgi:hypothetical protein
MVKIHKVNFGEKKVDKIKIRLDNIMSGVHSFIAKRCECRHTGKIKFVVNMRSGVPIGVKTILEEEKDVDISP